MELSQETLTAIDETVKNWGGDYGFDEEADLRFLLDS